MVNLIDKRYDEINASEKRLWFCQTVVLVNDDISRSCVLLKFLKDKSESLNKLNNLMLEAEKMISEIRKEFNIKE